MRNSNSLQSDTLAKSSIKVFKRVLASGDVIYRLRGEYFQFSYRFNPTNVKNLLRSMVKDLFDKARSGKADGLVSTPDPAVSFLIEVKRRNVKKLAWGENDEEEVQREIEFYSGEAFRKFEESFEDHLRRSPHEHVVKIMAATIGDLNKDGALRLQKGPNSLYEEIFLALLNKFKIQWDAPGTGETELTGERLRAKFLEYYESIEAIAKVIKKKGDKRGNNKIEAAAELAKQQVSDDVQQLIKNRVVAGHYPGRIAWDIATQKYLTSVSSYSPKILTKARKEREERGRSSLKTDL